MGVASGLGLFRTLIVGILLPITLSACASIAGSQASVISVTESARLVAKYPVDAALAEYALQGTPELRKQYRDLVIGVYMTAIEANYREFRTRVRAERTELSLGADIVGLAFTSYATVARRTIVNDLSAAAAAFGGARGALDRDVYFDRALPGLLAAMDAEHLRRRAALLENLERPAAEYPLAVAFADLSDLELAGSLDRAIEDITARAAQDRQAAQQEVRTAVRSCRADADATPVMGKLSRYVRGLAAATPASDAAQRAQKLRRIALEMQLAPAVSTSPNSVVIRDAIIARITQGANGRCGKADLEALIASIQGWTGDTIN